MTTDVQLQWRRIGAGNEAWDWARTFYAFHLRGEARVLYLGKADYQTIGQRVRCASKDGVWDHLDHVGIQPRQVGVIAAEVVTDARWTSELQADVESLLIARIKPVANVQCVRSRIERPGLRITCGGAWPEKRARFRDAA